CVPVIQGDGQSYYETSHQAQFRGQWSPPAKPSKKRLSAIKFGDARISGSMSEQKHAFRAPDKRTHRTYNKEHAASQIHRTNLQLGDGCTRLPTSTSELFPVHNPDESSVSTMQALLVPHGQQKRQPSKDVLQQIKHSPLGLPRRAQDVFGTEQEDEFTPKSRAPAGMQKTNSQVSCIPQGTRKGSCPRRKLLHGRVQLELRGTLRLRALEVYARGRAVTHWLESHSVGLNIVYRDYTAYQTFLYRRRQLIP
ncbi:PREDICTED: uncharacterized protein LOC104376818, partial [Tauraco erythrolophus]|uniref:uncharacterized protein LOC104376818 n=1 Tax=Tauraco erythrolophus TaxID=121530 RepID=UPI00052326E8